MKARIKDTSQILEVMTVKLENGFYYSLDKIEFEQEPNNTSDHWQDLRERVAIAILQAMVTDKDFQRYSAQYKSEMAIAHADALVKKLKGE